MMFRDMPSTPDTFSQKRLTNTPPRLCTASSAPLFDNPKASDWIYSYY